MNLRAMMFVATVLGLAAVASCGGDDPPVCPTGDCSLPGSTVVKWKFNNYPQYKFDSDACSDVGAVTVRVEMTQVEDPAITDFLDKGCGEGQATFIDLPFGMYNVSVLPLDLDGNVLVSTGGTGQILAGSSGAHTEVTVNVPYTAWTKAYTGQFLYRLSWGGPAVSCEASMPLVKNQTVTLTAGGVVRTEKSSIDNMPYQQLDGTDPKPCRALSDPFPQNVMGIPFGPATLLVVGTDATDAVVFRTQFDTFIGVGVFNPTLSFDVTPGM
ncbi:MAG: hypothetical protein JWP01_3655 [Myxococcales bacterium]|nr:hypothetical protein [Myxococcales bacterium]